MKSTNLIYGLRDPRNDVYKYIGKTTVGEKRPLMHLKKSHNILVNQWVDELKQINLSPIVDVIENNVSLEQLTNREMYYITYYSDISDELFNGGKRSIETISKPSILSETDINSLYISFLNTIEIYKLFKSSTAFTDSVIASALGVRRKTVYNIRKGNIKISMETIFKLIVFIKKGTAAVFEHYYSHSNEFQGKHPDTYAEFINECKTNDKFCTRWFTSFYNEITNKDKNLYGL
jgi:DNA-binding XRE family transcriptional regulator